MGIDAAAHYGALYEAGKTIAVLGSGIKNLYPKENTWLYNLIIQNNGCVITEHDDDEEINLSNFPQRNRIISGIADAILIIEAEYRSGTSITAKFAKEQGKKIYCIPSNLDSKNGIGTNKLIRNGAILVTEAEQIIEDLYDTFEEYKQEEVLEIPDNYKQIYELIKNNEITSDELSRETNVEISKLNSILTMMELDGYIHHEAGNILKINKERK